MTQIDWTLFQRRVSIKKDLKTIFNSWTSQSELENWFLRDASFFKNGKAKTREEIIELGDQYKWTWHGSTNVAEGEVLAIEEGKSLKFSFLGCVVTVVFKEENGENVIELEQSEIPTDEASKLNYYVECTRGWTFYLTNLKSILEGGIDLRNKNMDLKQVINT